MKNSERNIKCWLKKAAVVSFVMLQSQFPLKILRELSHCPSKPLSRSLAISLSDGLRVIPLTTKLCPTPDQGHGPTASFSTGQVWSQSRPRKQNLVEPCMRKLFSLQWSFQKLLGGSSQVSSRGTKDNLDAVKAVGRIGRADGQHCGAPKSKSTKCS